MAEETKPTLPRPRKSGRPSRGTGVVATNLVNRYTNQSSAENNTNPTVSPKRGRTGITDISSSSTTTNTSNSSEQLVQINKTEQGLLSDIKKILKEHLNFVKRKSDVPRVQLVRKKKLIDDPMEKYTPSALLKRGLDAGKEKIKEKIFGKKTSGINKLTEKKQIEEIGSDKGILRKVIPNIISTLGSSIGALIPLLTKIAVVMVGIIGVLLAAALGAGLGYMLFKSFIEPMMDKEQAKRNKATAKTTKAASMTKEDVKTDTGEKVFEREDTKTGKIKYVTEKQMADELKTMSPEEQEKVKSGGGDLSFRQAQNTIDLKSGMYSGFKLQSGKSIEQINQASDENKKFENTAPPKQKAQRNIARKIVQFDRSFRTRFQELTGAWNQTHGEGDEVGELAGDKTFEAALDGMRNEQQVILDTIRRDETLSDDEKKDLLKLSGLFEGGLSSDPSIGGFTSYNLPSGQQVALNYADRVKTQGKNGTLSTDINDIGVSSRAEAITAQFSAQDAIDNAKKQAEASSNEDQKQKDLVNFYYPESKKTTQQPPELISAPKPETTGDKLQNQAIQMRAPDMIAAPTPVAGGNTIINNYNTAPAKQPTLLSGGGGDNGGGSATPPDDSGMHAALTKDLSRSASMGNHT